MAKRLVCLLLAALLAVCCPLCAGAQEGQDFTISVGGQVVADAHVILADGVTYVSAYNVARALAPDTAVAWNGGSSEMTLAGTGYALTAQLGRDYVVCNGRYLYTPGQVLLHPDNGDLLLPVRVLARALGAQVEWDGQGVYLTATGVPLESGETFYNAEDLRLLATVIRHEAGYEPLAGQIAVGNVLLNRAAGNGISLYEVITRPNQFPGALNATPGDAHYIAAKLCLDGAKTVPDSAYWFNGAGKSCWASQNKTLLCTIGGHAFYG